MVIDHIKLFVLYATKKTSIEGTNLILIPGFTLKEPFQKNMSEATSAAKIETGM